MPLHFIQWDFGLWMLDDGFEKEEEEEK